LHLLVGASQFQSCWVTAKQSSAVHWPLAPSARLVASGSSKLAPFPPVPSVTVGNQRGEIPASRRHERAHAIGGLRLSWTGKRGPRLSQGPRRKGVQDAFTQRQEVLRGGAASAWGSPQSTFGSTTRSAGGHRRWAARSDCDGYARRAGILPPGTGRGLLASRPPRRMTRRITHRMTRRTWRACPAAREGGRAPRPGVRHGKWGSRTA
jgi:hypothetical protein